MNMQALNKNLFFLLLIFGFSVLSCKKEKQIIYGVEDVEVKKDGANKQYLKSTIEFISIAYSDIFNSTIPQNKLADLNLAYLAFGDKKLIESIIIKNFLKQNGASIPSNTEMRADIKKFIRNTYRKFYNRNPDEYEEWYLEGIIKDDSQITSEIIYFAFLTSNEYRYY
jgi:hypothetical protein